MPPTKPTLRYAQADTDARFQVSEDLIYIEQRPPMLIRVFVWTIAAGMIALRLLRKFPQIESRLGIQQIGAQSWGSELLYLAIVLLLVASGFQSSIVRVDFDTQRAMRDARWGPFRRRRVLPLSVFDHVLLDRGRDTDGPSTRVQLRGGDVRFTILDGDSRRRSVDVARALAKRLKLHLMGLDEDEVDDE